MTLVKLPLEFFLAYILQRYQNKDPGNGVFLYILRYFHNSFSAEHFWAKIFAMKIYWISSGIITWGFLIIKGEIRFNLFA